MAEEGTPQKRRTRIKKTEEWPGQFFTVGTNDFKAVVTKGRFAVEITTRNYIDDATKALPGTTATLFTEMLAAEAALQKEGKATGLREPGFLEKGMGLASTHLRFPPENEEKVKDLYRDIIEKRKEKVKAINDARMAERTEVDRRRAEAEARQAAIDAEKAATAAAAATPTPGDTAEATRAAEETAAKQARDAKLRGMVDQAIESLTAAKADAELSPEQLALKAKSIMETTAQALDTALNTREQGAERGGAERGA